MLVIAATATVLAVPLSGAEALATDCKFACNNIAPHDGYEPCIGDRWTINPGRFVRIKNVASGGKSVRFRAYSVSGHHKLGETADLNPGGIGLVWCNDTGSNIVIDIEADPDSNFVEVNVNA